LQNGVAGCCFEELRYEDEPRATGRRLGVDLG
jgi:hypothetical protein